MYLCRRALAGRPHFVANDVLDIWHMCCRLCRVHSWQCMAGRRSDQCPDRDPVGSVSDSDLDGGNVPVHLHLRGRKMTQDLFMFNPLIFISAYGAPAKEMPFNWTLHNDKITERPITYMVFSKLQY